MKAYGGWIYSSTHSLTSALDGCEWSASRPGRFTPRERDPGTHWIGGWVGPRAVISKKVMSTVFVCDFIMGIFLDRGEVSCFQ
jgi:hypothetical protein